MRYYALFINAKEPRIEYIDTSSDAKAVSHFNELEHKSEVKNGDADTWVMVSPQSLRKLILDIDRKVR